MEWRIADSGNID